MPRNRRGTYESPISNFATSEANVCELGGGAHDAKAHRREDDALEVASEAQDERAPVRAAAAALGRAAAQHAQSVAGDWVPEAREVAGT